MLLLLVAAPLLMPVIELLLHPLAWSVWIEADRIATLFTHTITLSFGTLLISLPLGIVTAVILERGNLSAHKLFALLLVFGLFIPLPLMASAWQIAFGTLGPRPWDTGLFPAILIHSIAAFPWVVLILILGLRRVEPELEEDALQVMRGIAVVWSITLRRIRPALVMATLWVLVQTSTEIVVTDLMLVRTMAEEVYTQFVTSSIGGARAMALTLPTFVIAGVIAFSVTNYHPGLLTQRTSRQLFEIPRWASFLGLLILFAIVAIPSINWLIKIRSVSTFLISVRGQFYLIFDSLLWAIVAAVIALSLAILAAWQSLESVRFRRCVVVLAVCAWVMPGPVLGIGMKSLIDLFMDVESFIFPASWIHPLTFVLYEEANPSPVVWVHVVRLFPFALALVAPVVASIPIELRESAKLDGASPLQILRHVILPPLRWFLLPVTLVLSLLVLGEVSASKLVQIPGHATFAQEFFNQMHYGVSSTLASLGVLQIIVTLGVFAFIVYVSRGFVRSPNSDPGNGL